MSLRAVFWAPCTLNCHEPASGLNFVTRDQSSEFEVQLFFFAGCFLM